MALLLLIPSIIGMKATKINYDILVYLPEDVETIQGENILSEDFNMGAFTIISVDNTSPKDILSIEKNIKKIDGVNKVLTIDDLTGTTIPIEMLPEDLVTKVVNGDDTLMLVTFEDTTSTTKTLDAVSSIRTLMKDYAKVGGMSAVVLDTMNLSNKEVAIYVIIAVILCIVVLSLSLDSYAVPFILLLNIGLAILYNMGSNIIFGNISYITKAISAVLQLGVTTDFSIFLYHKYEKNKETEKNKDIAMSNAISETIVSVLGSSLTTIAGFLALCTMNLTLGKDIGLVMAKGVLFGLLTVITVFPSLLLVFDKLIEKTKHKKIIPEFKHIKSFSLKYYKQIFVVFLILIIPAVIGNANSKVYYNLDRSLPKTLDSIVGNEELKEKFNIVSPEIILIDKDIKSNEVNEIISKLKKTDGIDLVLSYAELSYLGIPDEMLDKDVSEIFQNDKYQMIFINSKYEIASNELNNQITEVNKLVKSYDKNAIIAGEGPLTNDLIKISDTDFKNVNYTSIIAILIIMVFVLKSASLPVLLISAIEFAIFVNVSISYYTGVTLPFIASIVIGTIQLGATIDYAILMTTKYIELRKKNIDKKAAMKETLDSSVNSIFVSGMCFFAATFGVSVYSDLELISSICTLIARGAIISMLVVILILPSLLMIFDKVICKTTSGFRKKDLKMKKKVLASLLLVMLLPLSINASTKEETVYSKLNSDGSVNKTIVSEHITTTKEGSLNDKTNLSNIVNVNGYESYKLDNNNLVWNAKGEDIYYQGVTKKSLPITIKVNYYLDGKEYVPSEIVGKKGNVKIVIKYTNNLKNHVLVNGSYQNLYTPFVVTMISTLDKDNNSNLTISNGKVIDNCKNYSIIGLSTPGLYESLDMDSLKDLDTITIEYKTTSYEFNSMYNVASAGLLSDVDLDSFDKLNSIYSSVDKLKEATNQIQTGSTELLNGLNDYKNKYGQFNNGMTSLSENVNLISSNYTKFNNGLSATSASASKLLLFTNSISDLSKGLQLLSTSTSAISKESESINTLLSSSTSTIATHIASLEKIRDNTTDEDTKTAINIELKYLEDNLDMQSLLSVKSKISDLNTNIAKINGSMLSLASSSTELNKNIAILSATLNTLSDNSNSFNENLIKLNSSVSYLSSLSNEFYSGTDKLVAGASSLNSGIIKFNKTGISKISKVVNGEVKTTSKKLEKLIDLGNNYSTFTMKNKSDSGSTKFIMIVNE